MDWIQFGLTVVAAGVVSSLTDWFFQRVFFHQKRKEHPEVWRRPEGGPGERRAIAGAILLSFLSCAVFAYVCARLNFYAVGTTLKLALAVWVMAPLPVVITNALWVKVHPLLAVSHSLGWLAKFVVAALAVSYILF